MISGRYTNDGVATLRLNTLQEKTKAVLVQKLQSGEYSYETLNDCPLCNSKDQELLAEKDRYGIENTVAVCKDCGLVMTNPRMTQESYTGFYNDIQKKLYVGEERPSGDYFVRQKNKGKEIYEFLQRGGLVSDKQAMQVLEIGCGAGGILAYFQDQGHEVKGMDIGTTYIEFGKEKGLNIADGFLKDLSTTHKYDLIIYSHVMEHILDVAEELELIKSYLKPGGVLYIEVPGIKNVYQKYKMDYLTYFQSAHTFHFSLTTLKNWLSAAGYDCLVGTEFVRSAFRLTESDDSNEYKRKNDYEAVTKHIAKVDRYRSLFPLTPYFFKMKLAGLKQKFK